MSNANKVIEIRDSYTSTTIARELSLGCRVSISRLLGEPVEHSMAHAARSLGMRAEYDCTENGADIYRMVSR